MDPICFACGRSREAVSRHATSEGVVVYRRCACTLVVDLDHEVVLEGATCSS